MAAAQKLGIKTPDSYYNDGKIKGKSSRDKHIEGPKAPEKAPVEIRKVKVENANIEFLDQIEDVKINPPLAKPSLSDMPGLVKRGRAGELPSFLDGFKPLRRK